MNETLIFGNNLTFLMAQIINLIFVILLITLPFLIWRWFSKREKERKQQPNRIQGAALIILAILVCVFYIPPFFLQAQKNSTAIFQSRAKQVGVALQYHHEYHGEWPPTLDDIDPNLAVLPPDMLSYPALFELRDLPENYPTKQWLYFPPRSEDPSQIILAAPLPFQRSGNKIRRIVVRADATCEIIDELAFGSAMEKQLQTEQGGAPNPLPTE